MRRGYNTRRRTHSSRQTHSQTITQTPDIHTRQTETFTHTETGKHSSIIQTHSRAHNQIQHTKTDINTCMQIESHSHAGTHIKHTQTHRTADTNKKERQTQRLRERHTETLTDRHTRTLGHTQTDKLSQTVIYRYAYTCKQNIYTQNSQTGIHTLEDRQNRRADRLKETQDKMVKSCFSRPKSYKLDNTRNYGEPSAAHLNSNCS
jgi:hypothetical protein